MRTCHTLLITAFAAIVMNTAALAQDNRYDAWYESLLKEYTLNPDGSVGFRTAKVQKLLTYRAFHNLYGETFVVFDPAFQELKINDVYTIMADGKRTAAPKNSFNEVLPSFAAGAPPFNSLREMVITHTGLERDAVVHLDYTLNTKAGVLPALMGSELLAENEPVKSLEVRVRVPSGTELRYKLVNSDLKPVVTEEGSFKVYSWKLADVPSLSAEEGQPGGYIRYPRLIFSSSGDREAVWSFLTSQPAFDYALPEGAKKAVNAILEEKRDRFEAALKIQELVVNDVKLWPVPLKAALYKCRTPQQTWNENGGTAVEKAVLLASMLKFAGFTATVEAVVRTPFIDSRVATLADVEDFAVRMESRDRGTWYFSVTAANSVNLKFSLPGRSFVDVARDAKPEVSELPDPKFTVKVQGNFIVSSDPKLTGEVSIYYDGAAWPLAGMARDKKRMKNSLNNITIGNDSVNLKKSTLNNENGFQTWIAKSDNPFRKDSSYFYFTLPASASGIENWNVKTLSNKREAPYEVPALADESYTFTVALPAGMTLFTPKQKVALSNKAGRFTFEVGVEDGKVTVKRSVIFEARAFEGTRFTDFKALMDAWNNPWYRQLVFVKDTR